MQLIKLSQAYHGIASDESHEDLGTCLRISAILTRVKIAATWPARALGLATSGLTLRISPIELIVLLIASRSPKAIYLVSLLGL